MPGRVEAIHVAAREGGPMEAVSEAECRTDFGLVGDRYAKAGSRAQVTLVAAEDLAAAERELGGAIAPGATRRNIMIAGLPLPARGALIRVGGALLEITDPADPCGLMDRCIGPGAKTALAGRAGTRARVLEGGVIRVGDGISLEAAAAARAVAERS